MITIKNIKNNSGATYVFVVIVVLFLMLQLTLLISLTINSRGATSAHSENVNRKIIANFSVEKAVDMLNKTLNAAEEGSQIYNTAGAFEKINSDLNRRFKSINGSIYETRFEITLDKNSTYKKVYAVTVTVKYLAESFEITSTVVETRNQLSITKYTSKVKSSAKFNEGTQKLYIVSLNTVT